MSKERNERLRLLVGLLKTGQDMSAKRINVELERKAMRQVDRRTLLRDVACLRDEFGAPVDYDASRRSYVLVDLAWKLPLGLVRSEALLPAALALGSAQASLPGDGGEELGEMQDALFLAMGGRSREAAESLIVSSSAAPAMPEGVLATLLEGWRSCRRIQGRYRSSGGRIEERQVELHALYHVDGFWYAAAYCHRRLAPRTFALHRFDSAEILPERFRRDETLVRRVRDSGGFTDMDRLEGVELRLRSWTARTAQERPPFPGASFRSDAGGLLMSLSSAPSERLVSWILSQGGMAVALAPAKLKRLVLKRAEGLVKSHGG
ncbi:MAG: hypothetical protein RL095_119 [Verrucomicrobiota bacterium]|jgi:predicted DNA-binding transcriptional regulator YafY